MKGQTLKENKDFRRLYYRGKSEASPVLVTYAMKNRRGSCFYGITTSKKIGGAVERNRARRVIRAAYRSRRIIRAAFQSVFNSGCIKGNWDFVFVARTRTTIVKSQAVEKAMLEHMQALGAIDE